MSAKGGWGGVGVGGGVRMKIGQVDGVGHAMRVGTVGLHEKRRMDRQEATIFVEVEIKPPCANVLAAAATAHRPSCSLLAWVPHAPQPRGCTSRSLFQGPSCWPPCCNLNKGRSADGAEGSGRGAKQPHNCAGRSRNVEVGMFDTF